MAHIQSRRKEPDEPDSSEPAQENEPDGSLSLDAEEPRGAWEEPEDPSQFPELAELKNDESHGVTVVDRR